MFPVFSLTKTDPLLLIEYSMCDPKDAFSFNLIALPDEPPDPFEFKPS
jgi:hypothetical protein